MVEVPPRVWDEPTLSVTLTGRDRPGVTSALFAAVAGTPATVLDVEQVVVRGRLILAVLLTTGGSETVRSAVLDVAERLDMKVRCRAGRGDSPPRPAGRMHVTLLAAPLLPAAVAAVAERIAGQGANIDRIRRLSRWPVTTIEIDVSGGDVPSLRHEIASTAAAHGIDAAVAPAGLSRRGHRLVVMDVDSTLVQGEVIEVLASRAGRRPEVAAVTERAMRGELDFTASLHERVAQLAGLPASVLDDVRQDLPLAPGARTLVRTLKRLGFSVALVSGGFAEVVEPLGRELGVDHVRANRLEVADGLLTGRVEGDVVDRAGKARALREFAAAEGLSLARTVAIGDGANDLDMLDAAGLGIAFNAKPVVREQAEIAVSVPFLDSVLYLMGIPRQDVEDADAADGLPVGAPLDGADPATPVTGVLEASSTRPGAAPRPDVAP
ncbi:MAG: phosphoserine phosphatase SerB [Angustibacter sp.]